MRYGLLGGAFDPIHNGHLQMARAVLQAELVDYVLLMPCYSHVYDKNMVSAKHRFNMCMDAVATPVSSMNFWLNRIRADPFEIKHKMAGRTIETIEKLQAKNPKDTFDVIIGADNANTITNWYDYGKLITTVKFIILPRKGQVLQGMKWYNKEPHCILPVSDIGYSSTEIRGMLKTWWETGEHEEELTQMVNCRVFDYIKWQKLYKGVR